MNNYTISFKEMINYIWKKKIFLIIWILAINSVFIIYLTIQPKSEFKAEVKYRFPQSEISTDSMSEVLDFLQRGKTFSLNFQWLSEAVNNDLLNNQFIFKNNNNQKVSISLISKSPDNLEDDILNFVNKIDSLFIEDKLSELLAKKNNISDQIEKLDSGKNTFENTVITKKLNEILGKLIVKEYLLKNLTTEMELNVQVKDISISKNLLFFVSLIFSIWSGLMIVIILYFIKQK